MIKIEKGVSIRTNISILSNSTCPSKHENSLLSSNEKLDVITEEIFMNRIQISEITATSNGELVLYYNDDL